MKRALAATLDALLCGLGAERWFRFRNRNKLLILMYHGVVRERLTPFCWHQLPVHAFRQQLAWIAKRYHVMHLDDALEAMTHDRLPPRAAAITFDDGFRNNATLAAPVLRDLNLPATIFLAAGAIGTSRVLWPDRVYLAVHQSKRNRVDATCLGLGELSLESDASRGQAIHKCLGALKRQPVHTWASLVHQLEDELNVEHEPTHEHFQLMDWSDVATLRTNDLIRFGGHTMTHPILSRLECKEDVHKEIVESIETIRSQTDGVSPVFAYPNGRPEDFDVRAQDVLRAQNVPWAVTTSEGLATKHTPPLTLPRICIGSDLPFRRFRLLCSGLWSSLRGYVD